MAEGKHLTNQSCQRTDMFDFSPAPSAHTAHKFVEFLSPWDLANNNQPEEFTLHLENLPGGKGTVLF